MSSFASNGPASAHLNPHFAHDAAFFQALHMR